MSTSSQSCGVQAHSYAGYQASTTAHGVSATLVSTVAPSVSDGHVGGWIGVGGESAGLGGSAEWLQTGLVAFPGDQTLKAYYEVTVPGGTPQYVELSPRIAPGQRTKFTVLEMAHRTSWWRVWLDNRPVSPPIYLPGSNGTWEPQMIAENWNGGVGACNAYSYRFSNVTIAAANGGSWQPMKTSYTFQDPGYGVVPVSNRPDTFVASRLSM